MFSRVFFDSKWNKTMNKLLLASAFALSTTAAVAEPVPYTLDPSHSQIVFNYDHFGFSTTYGMFSGFEGDIQFDVENPENSAVTVSFPVTTMLTGWEGRLQHFMSADFFDAAAEDMVTFTSTAIEVTGEGTANITGDLTMNGVTKAVVLDTKLNGMGQHPMAGKDWAGFDATTTVLRSDFDLGQFAPMVSDEVQINISIEAGITESDAS